jgi:DNA replication initiation complex subunit (GINS family)
MYDEVFAAWRFEVENIKLGKLPADFYTRVADYVRRIKEETRMLDRKTVKAGLLESETERVQRMISELVWARYRKLLMLISEEQKVPSDLLAVEEESLCAGFLSFSEAYHGFVKRLLLGQVLEVGAAKMHRPQGKAALRFLKAIPAIVGVDMKTYGPFMAEDVGSVPVENAKGLVKRGLAEVVEVS